MDTGRISCEDRGRDWGGASTCQETPKIVGKLPERSQKRANDGFYPQPSGRTNSTDLDVRPLASRFLLFEPLTLWSFGYGSFRTPEHLVSGKPEASCRSGHRCVATQVRPLQHHNKTVLRISAHHGAGVRMERVIGFEADESFQ